MSLERTRTCIATICVVAVLLSIHAAGQQPESTASFKQTIDWLAGKLNYGVGDNGGAGKGDVSINDFPVSSRVIGHYVDGTPMLESMQAPDQAQISVPRSCTIQQEQVIISHGWINRDPNRPVTNTCTRKVIISLPLIDTMKIAPVLPTGIGGPGDFYHVAVALTALNSKKVILVQQGSGCYKPGEELTESATLVGPYVRSRDAAKQLSERVASGIKHAVELCGGQTEPF